MFPCMYGTGPFILTERSASDPPALRWLGVPATDDYVWYLNSVYHSFKEYKKENGPPALDPEKPHAVCYVVDSTPLDVYFLRTSEVKTIILVALFNHVKPEYNHQDSFGVSAAMKSDAPDSGICLHCDRSLPSPFGTAMSE